MIGDAPGQLARVAGLIGEAGGNIVEVLHQRLFGVVAKATELDVTVETRDRAHVGELVAALEADGFKVRVLEGADAKSAALQPTARRAKSAPCPPAPTTSPRPPPISRRSSAP